MLTELIIVNRIGDRPLLKENMGDLVMRGVGRGSDAGGPSSNNGYLKMLQHCYKNRSGLESLI